MNYTKGWLPHICSGHQLFTTTDFALENTLVIHVLGGINHPAMHHLFSDVSNVHYSASTEMTRQTATEFNLTYRCFPTIQESVISHFNFLKRMVYHPISLKIPIFKPRLTH